MISKFMFSFSICSVKNLLRIHSHTFSFSSSLLVLQDIIRGYEDRSIPLDVLVTDMDWHITFYKESSEGKRDQVSV